MAIININVSQLKCACLSESWRKRFKNGENPSTFCTPPPGSIPVYGTRFHRIVERFTCWLSSDEQAKMGFDTHDETELWQKMYDHFAIRPLSEILDDGKTDSALHLCECLKSFCRRLIDLKKKTPGMKSWQDLYLTQEFLIRDILFKVGPHSLFISGQADAVRSHPKHGIEVVDYKLSQGTNSEQDLVQLAIYAKLLKIKKPGLSFHGVIEYFEPELRPVSVSSKELRSIFAELVEPILIELFTPEDHAGILGDSPSQSPSRKSRNSSPPAPVKENSPDLSEKIRECYRSFKLDVTVLGHMEAPQLVRYSVKPAKGVKVVSLANRAEDLQVALSLPMAPLIEPARGSVSIDIPKDKTDTVFWEQLRGDAAWGKDGNSVSFPVGISVKGRLIFADFSDPNMCHALIAGASGSGKSEFLKAMVASLISKNTPDTLRLSIIDPKILTFGPLNGSPYLTGPVITEMEPAISCLQSAASEMDKRYRILEKEGFENLKSRFQAGLKEIPYCFIVFDEFADLILSGKEEKKEFENLVARIAAKGRAAGIHLVLATQRPDRNIVTGQIKANLPLKICLRVTTSANSQIVLDQAGGESLLGRGDLLCDLGRGVARAQSPYVSREELLALAQLPDK
ncbi:MAG: cell division protein FtsK [Desulfobacteraceae bacterium]|nr:cell division protein FtsK [Desulfobacteraceae bacterium]